MDNEKIIFSAPNLNINVKQCDSTLSPIIRDMHFHTSIELVRVDRGSVRCEFENDTVVIYPYEMVLINRSTIHRLVYNESNTSFTYIQIDMNKYIAFLTNAGEHSLYSFMSSKGVIPYKVFSTDSELFGIFDDIESEISEMNNCFESYITADIYRIGAIMQRHGLFLSIEGGIDKKTIEMLFPAILYAEKNFSSKVHLEEASKTVNMDKFYFCKLFKRATGATYIEYVTFLRLQKAQHLLINTSMNISQIALHCGFESTQYLNRVFKKRNGCLPSAYRRMHLY